MTAQPLPARLPATGFTVDDARRVGVTRARTRASDLRAPYPRTRVSRSASFALRDRCALVLRLLRPDAVVCGLTAAALHRIPLPAALEAGIPGRVEVAVPPNCRAPRIEGVRGRSLAVALDEVDRRHGFRATTPERTWCDLGAELPLASLVAAGDHLIHRWDPTTTRDLLATHVERARGRRGYRSLVEALPLLSDAAESPKESETRVLLMRAGLPHPEVNVVIYDEHGRFVARVDLLMREFGIVLEYEGDHHRSDPVQWRRDIARTGDLESLGLVVVRVTAADLASPSALIARIERHLRRRGWLPGPSWQ